jgi:hypothetical protein
MCRDDYLILRQVEQDPSKHECAMVCFYPQFEYPASQEFDVTFLVDRSASMRVRHFFFLFYAFLLSEFLHCYFFVIERGVELVQGEAMEDARLSLYYLLKSLPPNALFNIVGFGSHTQSLFPAPMR